MAHAPRWAALAAAIVLAGAGCVLTGCTPASAPPARQTAQADRTDGGTQTDGPVDPGQQTRRSGPAVELGGPPFGLQSLAEVDGGWCATVALFWGGDAPPQNVAFTITGITSDPAHSVTATARSCDQDASTSCIGVTMTPDTASVFCSMLLVKDTAFASGTQVGFSGELTCTEARFCDAAATRVADQGPPIVVGG